jgi:hypothetical protein
LLPILFEDLLGWLFVERIVEDVGEEVTELISNDIIFGGGDKFHKSSFLWLKYRDPNIFFNNKILISIFIFKLCITKDSLC